MKDRYEKIGTLPVLLVPLLFALTGGYLQWVVGYLYLFLLQGYVAWFLFFKSGQPFFGYSVTMALGAYGTIILTEMFHWSLLASISISAVMSAIVGVIVFLSTSRAKGFYVSMASFLLAILFPKLIEALQPITGGRSGLYFDGIKAVISGNQFYVIIILSTVVVVALIFWLMGTKVGKILTLISENDTLTQAVGINTFKYKILAYGVAGLLSGFGGALYVNYSGFISSIDIEVFTSLYIVFIPLIGGSRITYGPILGALFVILVPELLVSVERYLRIFFGVLFILVMVLLPDGITPNIIKLVRGVVSLLKTSRKEKAA